MWCYLCSRASVATERVSLSWHGGLWLKIAYTHTYCILYVQFCCTSLFLHKRTPDVKSSDLVQVSVCFFFHSVMLSLLSLSFLLIGLR